MQVPNPRYHFDEPITSLLSQTMVHVFTCLDDPTTGPRLQAIGIIDNDLVKYVVRRSQGVAHHDALGQLILDHEPNMREADYVGAILEKFPIPDNT
jgi:hypothetical protein